MINEHRGVTILGFGWFVFLYAVYLLDCVCAVGDALVRLFHGFPATCVVGAVFLRDRFCLAFILSFDWGDFSTFDGVERGVLSTSAYSFASVVCVFAYCVFLTAVVRNFYVVRVSFYRATVGPQLLSFIQPTFYRVFVRGFPSGVVYFEVIPYVLAGLAVCSAYFSVVVCPGFRFYSSGRLSIACCEDVWAEVAPHPEVYYDEDVWDQVERDAIFRLVAVCRFLRRDDAEMSAPAIHAIVPVVPVTRFHVVRALRCGLEARQV